jgi:hypothetical protein
MRQTLNKMATTKRITHRLITLFYGAEAELADLSWRTR